MVNHYSLTLEKLNKLLAKRNSPRTIEQINEWKANPEMDYTTNCVFVDEAGFNMHLRRNFGRSNRGIPTKQVAPSNRRILTSIIDVIYEHGVISLILRKLKPVTKSAASGEKEEKEMIILQKKMLRRSTKGWTLERFASVNFLMEL